MGAPVNGHAAALALVPAPPLFDLEERLDALANSVETVTPEQEQEFLAEFQRALAHATEKRDRVAGRLARLENSQAFAAAEIKRIHAFKKSQEAEQERLEGYVTYCIHALGKDAKGKWKKLEGNTSALFLRACAASLDVTDEPAIPLEYKSTTVTLPAAIMDQVLRCVADHDAEILEAAIAAAGPDGFSVAVDKRAAKAAIEAGVDVPGCRLIADKTSVGRK